MKHASTRALFEYWKRQRGQRSAPARSDIDPGDIRQVLGDTFMLSADFTEEIRFRLAGTRVCALFGREIKGESIHALWSEASRSQIDAILTAVIESIGSVAGVIGRTQKENEIELEMVIFPIAPDAQSRVRALGAIAPQVSPYWFGAEPVVELELRTLRHIGAGRGRMSGAGFGLRKRGSSVRNGFVVYSGGRSSSPDDQRS